LGYSFDGVRAPVNGRDHYSLAYTQFIMPLVKAVQEQQQIIEAQKSDIDLLKAQVAELTKASNTPPQR
jgi:trimeric autotransporter adhesin